MIPNVLKELKKSNSYENKWIQYIRIMDRSRHTQAVMKHTPAGERTQDTDCRFLYCNIEKGKDRED
jgi:hypothetical protein